MGPWWSWGDDTIGQTDIPPGLSNVVAIAAGASHSLALQSNGKVVGWGDDSFGEIDVPPGLSNVVAIAAGSFFSLALQGNGAVVAWGDDGFGETNVPPGLSNVVAVAAGGYHCFAIFNDGSPFITWEPVNANVYSGTPALLSFGAAGAPPLSYQWTLNGTNLPGATNATLSLLDAQLTNAGSYSVVVGNSLGVAASSSGTLTVIQSPPIIQVQPVSQTVPLGPSAATAAFSVEATGSLPLGYQWQLNGTNITGATGATLDLANASAGNMGNYRVIMSNSFGVTVSLSAALTQAFSMVAAWGDNSTGETNVPAELSNVVAIAAGGTFGLALEDNGTVVAWGDDTYGETIVPPGLSNVVAIAAGGIFGLALEGNGTVAAWGDDSLGQTDVPPGLTTVVAIAAGGIFSLALESNGTVVAWGDDTYGEANVPPGLSNVAAVAAGYDFALALEGDGTVVGWGDDTIGQTDIPPGLSNVVAVAAGYDFGLALEGNGTVVAWGDSQYGETNIPPGLSNVVVVAAGYDFGLALEGNGTVVTWGGYNSGDTNVPPGLSNVVSIASGSDALGFGFNLALLHEGSRFIVRQPVGQANYSGTTVLLSVVTLGELPSNYQWRLDGTNIVGATNATLSIADAQVADSGTYSVVVSNSSGTATSSGGADFMVSNSAPIVLVPPAGQTVLLGGKAAFSVAATGSLPLGYQWQLNGTNIAGATGAALVVANVSAANAGNYRVITSNSFGVTVSSSAALTQVFSMVAAWGGDTNAEIDMPAGLSQVMAIAAGYNHSLALEITGIVVGWGDDSSGEIDVPPGLSNVVAVAAGSQFSLALEGDGTVVGAGRQHLWGDRCAGGLEQRGGHRRRQ